jgi:hypothetical protein
MYGITSIKPYLLRGHNYLRQYQQSSLPLEDGKLDNRQFRKVPKLLIQKGKGKAIPLQAFTGPEGSTWLRLPDFKTIDI